MFKRNKPKTDQLDLPPVREDLDVLDYITDIPPSEELVSRLRIWAITKAEDTKSKVLLSLVSFFMGSVVFSCCLIFLAAVNNNVDKSFVETSIQVVLTCQSGLVGTAYGGYLLYSHSQRKSRQ